MNVGNASWDNVVLTSVKTVLSFQGETGKVGQKGERGASGEKVSFYNV